MTETAEEKPRKGGTGRPKGMRVVFCKACHKRVTGYPGTVLCKFCGTKNKIPDTK
jgi:hypothetical protein